MSGVISTFCFQDANFGAEFLELIVCCFGMLRRWLEIIGRELRGLGRKQRLTMFVLAREDGGRG